MPTLSDPFSEKLLDACLKGLQQEIHGALRRMLDAPDLKTARRLKDVVVPGRPKRCPAWRGVRGWHGDFRAVA